MRGLPPIDSDGFGRLLAREELRRSRTGESLAVVVLDVDGMRDVDARHGRDAGIARLRLCAGVLQATLRSVDRCTRTGPDEFSVLLHATDTRNGGSWANRFEDSLELAGQDHPGAPVTCAVGISDTNEEPTLMQAAERARRRMEVVQTVRKLQRARETGA